MGEGEASAVEILVVDEASNERKSFSCGRKLLLSRMQYFQTQIPKEEGTFAVTIHCEVAMFEWILKYIRNSKSQVRKLSVANVVSLLVSAHFLEVPLLGQACVQFIARRFDEVNALNVDFATVHESLLLQIADAVPFSSVMAARERVNQLVRRILVLRVTALLQGRKNGRPNSLSSLGGSAARAEVPPETLSLDILKFGMCDLEIYRCSGCGKLINAKQLQAGKCSKSRI